MYLSFIEERFILFVLLGKAGNLDWRHGVIVADGRTGGFPFVFAFKQVLLSEPEKEDSGVDV